MSEDVLGRKKITEIYPNCSPGDDEKSPDPMIMEGEVSTSPSHDSSAPE